MAVPMMEVWEMNVFVNHGFVSVWVRMRLDAIPRKIVYVPVVHVMSMSVDVLDCIVCVVKHSHMLVSALLPTPP